MFTLLITQNYNIAVAKGSTIMAAQPTEWSTIPLWFFEKEKSIPAAWELGHCPAQAKLNQPELNHNAAK